VVSDFLSAHHAPASADDDIVLDRISDATFDDYKRRV
jgi:hypothetical protein